MSVGNLEELIDENHAIVSSSVGPEYYVGILSFVDKDQLEPGCAILMHNKVLLTRFTLLLVVIIEMKSIQLLEIPNCLGFDFEVDNNY